MGWRAATIDLDIKIVSGDDSALRALPALKEKLQLNVELAAPDQFIPALPGWETRSLFIAAEGRASFYHYDFYAQALAKIERSHRLDLDDVRMMLERRLVGSRKLRELFDVIEPEPFRYPAIDAKSFKASVERCLKAFG